jgi:hypothetical protein
MRFTDFLQHKILLNHEGTKNTKINLGNNSGRASFQAQSRNL